MSWLIMPGAAAHANQMEILLEQWLGAQFPRTGARWEVWILSASPGLESLDQGKEYQVNGIKGVLKPKKIMTFIIASSGEKKRADIQLRARVVCYLKVATARRLLRRGELLTSQDYGWEERAAAGLPPDVIRQEGQMLNRRVKKVLTRNEILTVHALEPRPEVEIGKNMTLKVQGRGVVVSTDVKALEEGQPGKWIKIKHCVSGEVIQARVVNPDVVEIEMTNRW